MEEKQLLVEPELRPEAAAPLAEPEPSDVRHSRSRALVVAGLSALGCAAALSATARQRASAGAGAGKSTSLKTSSVMKMPAHELAAVLGSARPSADGVTLRLLNEHEKFRGGGFKFGDGYYDAIYPHLAELHRPVELHLDGLPDDASCDWVVSKGSSDEARYAGALAGAPATHTFARAGKHAVVATCAAPTWTQQYAFEVSSKYVRKEITALSDTERDAFLDSLQVTS